MDIFKTLRSLIVLFVLSISFQLKAQGSLDYWEFGPFLGTLNSSTDVATTYTSRAILSEMRPQIGFQTDYYFNSTIGVGVGAVLGFMYANDLNHSNPNRKLVVTSSMASLESHLTVNFLKYGRFRRSQHWAPYLTAGGGVGYIQTFNHGQSNVPAETMLYEGATLNGYWNVGIGVKFKLSLSRSVSIEINGSNLPSDRLEGFVYPDMESASDFFGGIRIRYCFMTILKPGTY